MDTRPAHNFRHKVFYGIMIIKSSCAANKYDENAVAYITNLYDTLFSEQVKFQGLTR